MNFIKTTYEEFKEYSAQVDNHLIIYGSGGFGQNLYRRLKSDGISVEYFCDGNEKLKGKIVEGIEVLTLSELRNISGNIDMVIGINSVEYHIIKEYLSEYTDIRANVFDIRNYKTIEKTVEALYNQEITGKEIKEKIGVNYLFELSKYIKNKEITGIKIDRENVAVSFISEGEEITICESEEMFSTHMIRELAGIKDEIYERRVMMKLINDGDTVFDVGANIGYYSILYSKLKSAKVYSFEPISTNFKYLCKNFELNSISYERAFNVGLSDKNKYADFYFSEEAHSAASMRNIVDLSDEKLELVNCELKTMDSFCEENDIKELDFIKCDAEGSELLIYSGGIETMKKFRPVVFSELYEHHTNMFGYHPNEVIDLFKKIDYVCMDINPFDGKMNFIEEILPSTKATNFLFIPLEKKDEIMNRLEIQQEGK